MAIFPFRNMYFFTCSYFSFINPLRKALEYFSCRFCVLLFGLKVKVKVTQSCLTLCDPMNCTVRGILQAQNTGVGSLSLLQGIFPTQGSNPGLPHCRRILYQPSHKGSPRILKWVAFPFSSGSSRPRNRTRVSSIAGGFFTSCATWESPTNQLRLHIN